jgi:phosphonate transport system substrate-binding protein
LKLLAALLAKFKFSLFIQAFNANRIIGLVLLKERGDMKRVGLFLLVFSLLLTVAACQPQSVEVPVEVTRVVTETEEIEVPVEVEVTRVVTETITETVVEEAEMAALGSEERPIKVLFVPSVEADAIITGGELLAEQLELATDLNYEVSVPTSYAATIEAMCASPTDTIGFIPALGYVLANERCGVTAALASVRFGWPYYWSQIIVRSDSGIESIEDLEGKTWGVPSVTSTSGYLVPLAQLRDAGVEPGEIVEFGGGHTAAALAVANGDVDFATTFFSPPLLPNRNWNPMTDSPEIWRDAGAPAELVDGRVFVAGGPSEEGYRILDARAAAMESYPTIFDETTILSISDEIPNDTMSFSSEFPLGLANQIARAVSVYVSSDDCLEPPADVVTLCSDSFYSWTGAEPVFDSAFDPVRTMIRELGLTEEDILN